MKITVKELRQIIKETALSVGDPDRARAMEVGEADAFERMAKVNDAIRSMEAIRSRRDPELSAVVDNAIMALQACQEMLSNRRDSFSGASMRRRHMR